MSTWSGERGRIFRKVVSRALVCGLADLAPLNGGHGCLGSCMGWVVSVPRKAYQRS